LDKLPSPRHQPVRFSLFLITVEVVMARKEEVGGAETHDVPYRSNVASSEPLELVSTGPESPDINEAQFVISQVEGVISIWPFCLIPR
jgi:hypothetical protein